MSARRARRSAVGAFAITSALWLGLGGCSGAQPAKPAKSEVVPVNDGGKTWVGQDGAAPGGGGETSSLASKESRHVARTLARMGEIRGFAAKKPVPGVKLERVALVGKIKEKALREYPPETLKREGQLLQLLGFAPASFDYLGEMMKLLEAQLEGFYEPKNGTMYLAADLHGAEAQATLAHELVHALQDQRWDLQSRSNYRPGQGDNSLALAALAEGDATSAMMDFIMKDQGRGALDMPDEMLRELMGNATSMGSVQSVPHVLRTTLVAPYIEGIAFVHGLRRKGGWAMVDKAWDRLPKTTEQVLHVDKWEADEPEIKVATPTATTLGAGWTKADEDTFGELGFALSLEEWLGASDARIAAAGWGGDRSAVFQKGDELALAVHFRYDEGSPKPEVLAERAIAKIIAGMKQKLGKPATTDGSAICFERADTGPLLFARSGRDVVMVAGPAKAGSKWTTSSTCATAKQWSAEVFAQK